MRLIYIIIGLFLILSSCNKEDVEINQRPAIEHIVFIGIDGWDVASFKDANIPTIKYFQECGAWTLKKQSVFPTSSGPNWVSMFTGLCVEQHGFTQWGSSVPDIQTPYQDTTGKCNTFFTEFRKEMPSCELGCLFEWNTIRCYIDTMSINYYRQVDQSQPTELSKQASEYIENHKPTVCAIIYDQLDHAGHLYGWDTDTYYAKLSEIDGYISDIVESVKKAGMYDSTVFIITSDHGGIENKHGDISEREMLTPLVVFGPNIRKGEINGPVMQFDVASLILNLFNIEQPSTYVGRNLSIKQQW